MANVLPREKKIAVIGALAGGPRMRFVEPIVGHSSRSHRAPWSLNRSGLQHVMDENSAKQNCSQIQTDGVWGFIGKKQKNFRRRWERNASEGATFGRLWRSMPKATMVATFHGGQRHTSENTLR
jgi:hypothetical protein